MGTPSTASRTRVKTCDMYTGILLNMEVRGGATMTRSLRWPVVLCPLLRRMPSDQYPPDGTTGGDGLLQLVKSNAKVCHALSCWSKSPVA